MPGAVGRAVVLQLLDAVRRWSRTGRTSPGGPEAVVEVLVPLVAERAVRRASRSVPAARLATLVFAPEAQLAVGGGHLDRAACQQLTVKIVPVSAFSGCAALRVERARVAPGARPRRRTRVDLARSRGSPCRRRACGTRCSSRRCCLPARLPEHLVAAEEGEVDAGVARRLDVGALRAGPVLVVADGQEDLVVADQRAGPVGVDAGRVADVVAVRLEPADHRVLGVEDPVLAAVDAARVERPVVADLVGAARRAGRADVEAVAAVVVVGLPGGVRRLEAAGPSAPRRRARRRRCGSRRPCRRADELGEVDARDRRRPARPTSADTAQLPQSIRPVGRVVRQAGWFCGSAGDGLTVATLRAPSPP